MASLYFRYGAMNCGKTTALLQVAHNYEENGLSVILLKSVVDTKGDEKVVSRLGVERVVDHLVEPNEALYPYGKKWFDAKIACILVDEAEFLTENQIIDLYRISKYYDIPVICYGLRTTFKAEFFSGSNALMRWADQIEEIINICSCGKKAKFQGRKINGKFVLEGKEVVIDGSSDQVEYVPLCGKCYLEHVYDFERKLNPIPPKKWKKTQ